ncbi:ABC transporter ATP-binding protein [Candidatus Berkelbacteria bacterium]|nr:ABC transporter ATP-binding protein [Candidatus Berkelbacteria bacterium]
MKQSTTDALAHVWKVLRILWGLLLDGELRGRYVLLVKQLFVSEWLKIGLTYAVSAIVLLAPIDPAWQVWTALIVCYLLLDELYLRLDCRLMELIAIEIDEESYRMLKEKALRQLFRLDLAWFQRSGSRGFVAKVNKGVEKVSDLVSLIAWEFIPNAIQLALTLVPILALSPASAGIALVAFLAFGWQTVLSYLDRYPLREARHDVWEEDTQRFDELAETHRTVVLMGQDERAVDDYRGILDRGFALGQTDTQQNLRKHHRPRARVLSWTKAGVYGVWIVQLRSGLLTLPSLVFVSTLFEKLLATCWRFSKNFERLMEASESVRRLGDLMAEEPTMQSGSWTQLPTGSVGFGFQAVQFDYSGTDQNGQSTLQSVSFTAEPGQVVAIVGKSGAGKSTISQLLQRLYDPQVGQVIAAGRPAPEWDLRTYRSLFAEVPQGNKVHIFESTIGANIAFGRPDATHKDIERAARQAGLHEFIVGLEQGYRTLVGERGHRLSGGQMQRLALARAFLANAPILILDEATSSLDGPTEQVILDGIREASHQKTVLVIAHRLSTIKDADLILVLSEGQIVERGTHTELLALSGHYAAQYAKDAETELASQVS